MSCGGPRRRKSFRYCLACGSGRKPKFEAPSAARGRRAAGRHPVKQSKGRRLRLEWVEAGSLRANPANWRKHPAQQVAALRESIADVGWAGALLYNERTKRLIDGHARRDNAEPTELVPVLVGHWTPEQERRILATLDPITALAKPDPEALGKLLDGLTFDGEALAKLGQDLAREIVLPAAAVVPGEVVEPEVPKAPRKPVTRKGDVWKLGRHLLTCGDCTQPGTWKRLGDNTLEDDAVMLTDPPYCSGGFQEASRKGGSVGRTARSLEGRTKLVARDNLSSRGYQSMIMGCIEHADTWGVSVLYVFMDWRMWVWNVDLCERCGYAVRCMVVWNKMSPALGVGWRSQHELVICGSKSDRPFDPKKAQGNVIDCKRIPHVNHETEKPVGLIATILGVNPHRVVVDPFAGAGATLLAAEQLDRTCRSIELEPKYCDVIVERWQALTTGKAKRVKR